MTRYLVRIRYLGCGFSGFQFQPDRRTVQGCLTQAFTALFGSECRVSGCSRTDAGVHANEAFVLVEEESGHDVPTFRIPQAIAIHLPPDLSVTGAWIVGADFHVRHDVIKKRYVYLLHNSPVKDPLSVGRAWQFPYPFPGDAEERMKAACVHLIGEHDFASFMAQGSPVPHTVRHIYTLTAERTEDGYRFSVEANGFLYNMVRIIVGTLVDVGMHRMEPEDIPAVLRSKNRSLAGETAPPDGLYLDKVTYPDRIFHD